MHIGTISHQKVRLRYHYLRLDLAGVVVPQVCVPLDQGVLWVFSSLVVILWCRSILYNSLTETVFCFQTNREKRRAFEKGKTHGRGHKGQGQRGTLPRLGFEGGNTPFYLRIPKEPYYQDHQYVTANIFGLREQLTVILRLCFIYIYFWYQRMKESPNGHKFKTLRVTPFTYMQQNKTVLLQA